MTCFICQYKSPLNYKHVLDTDVSHIRKLYIGIVFISLLCDRVKLDYWVYNSIKFLFNSAVHHYLQADTYIQSLHFMFVL